MPLPLGRWVGYFGISLFRRLTLVITTAFLVAPGVSHAQFTIEWVVQGGDWTEPDNWQRPPGPPGGGPPDLTDSVLISEFEALVILSGDEETPASGIFESLTLYNAGAVSVQGFASLTGQSVIIGTNSQTGTIQVINEGSSASFSSITLASGSGTEGFFGVNSGGSADTVTLTIGAGGTGEANVGGGTLASQLIAQTIVLAGEESFLSVNPLGTLISENVTAESGEITIGPNSEMRVEQAGVFSMGTVASQSVSVGINGGELSITSIQGEVAVIGESGSASMSALNGAAITTDGLVLGSMETGSGSLVLDDSTLRSFGEILAGSEGEGNLFVRNGATLTAQSASNVLQSIVLGSSNPVSEGALVIGGAPAIAPGTIHAAEVRGDASGASLVLFSHSASDYTFAPALNGLLAVEIVGGSTTWTGNNSFSGSLNVFGGELIVNGTHTPVTAPVIGVAENAILGGNGVLVGNTTVHGILSPGDGGIGTFSIEGDVTWNSSPGQAWLWDLAPANQSDTLAITGSLLRGTGDEFVFDFSGISHTGQFTLITWTGDNEISLQDFWAIGFGPGHFLGEFAFSGNSLVVTVVPEPSSLLLLLTAAGFFLLLQRRRKIAARI